MNIREFVALPPETAKALLRLMPGDTAIVEADEWLEGLPYGEYELLRTYVALKLCPIIPIGGGLTWSRLYHLLSPNDE